MEVPKQIETASKRLKRVSRVNRVTVRDFLGHFGVERRGAAKVEGIRRILSELDLETEPDFATAWIDGPIRLVLKQGLSGNGAALPPIEEPDSEQESADAEEIVLEGTPSAIDETLEQSELAPMSAEPDASQIEDNVEASDPTFRIGSLPAANRRLVVVNQDDSVVKAVTLMLENDFSQLPVMQGEREVRGVVTWKSIASRQVISDFCHNVGKCREDARIVDSNRTLFDAIPTIVEYGYVLVRQHDRRITGIVTASDLSLQFQALSEPFLLLREIELHVRRLIGNYLTSADFNHLLNDPALTRKYKDITDLTMGDYIRLLQNPEVWAKLRLRIDRESLIKLLETVRSIRNDVMHFDPDPMTVDELNVLKRAVRFMQDLHEISS